MAEVTGEGATRRGEAADWAAILMVWSSLLLLPFGRLVEASVLLMAAAGVFLVALRGGSLLAAPGARLFTAVFLASWIPILLSLPDAVDFKSSARVALTYPRFYLAGIFIIYFIASRKNHARLLRLSAWLLALWVADGFIQLALGRDVLGFEADAGRINALFGDRNPKYGIMLGVLSPVLFEHARRRWHKSIFIAAVTGAFLMVLLVGTRSSWIMLFVIAASYLALLWIRDRRLPWRSMLVIIVASALMLTALYAFSTRFSSRVDSAISSLTGHAETTKTSVGHRFFIWKGAISMIAAHPLNGVGARGFRDAFPEHAASDDPFMAADPPIVPTHSHQLVLELLAETGILGLMGTVIMMGLLIRAAVRTDSDTKRRIVPYGICICAAYFPLNTHLAIYSSLWSQVLWWILAVYCACFFRLSERPHAGAIP